MMELTERRKHVLAIIVRDYITTATPVSSAMIASNHELGISPATIRNEMAALEEGGYLSHPHTSAGRVPTIEGYRYFVKYLMESEGLQSREQRMIRAQFYEAGWAPDAWVQLSASVLARVAHSASLVTAPKASQSKFKHMELVELRDTLILLVLVLADGTLQQARFNLPEAHSQEGLSALADQLNDKLAGLNRRAIEAISFPQISPIPLVVNWVVELMADVDRRLSGEMVHAGLEHMLRQPEFADTERVTEAVQVLERREFLGPILADVARSPWGVHIIIAGGDRWGVISDYGLVLANYGADDARGALGILGPVRMPYERAVSVVRYVSTLMSGLLREFYGQDEPDEASEDVLHEASEH